jgi:hypothetical protein
MKKIIIALVFVLSCTGVFAKKIRFAVDMGTHTISPMGVHLMGDFQAYLGLTGGDWQPNTLRLHHVGGTIYDTVLDLPAFAKYEFRYVSGDQGYEAEFVPNMSRVEPYGFIDNRWIYLDSLANDTTFVGIIPFSGNAPAGKHLIRFVVDMSNEPSVSPNGVHVGGTFQSSTWNAKNNILYSFGANLYEVIAYAPTGTYEFKYYNGNQTSNIETVSGSCTNINGNRTQLLTQDTIVNTVCYKACVSCSLAGVYEFSNAISGMKLYPNPTNDQSTLEFTDKDSDYTITVSDLSGRTLRSYQSVKGEPVSIRKEELTAGIYFVTVGDGYNARSSSKLIIE